MNNNDKSITMVADLLKQKYHPKEYAAEQKAKEEHLKETLAFVEGVEAALALKEEEKAKDAELKKANILFVTDPTSHCGFRPNKGSK